MRPRTLCAMTALAVALCAPALIVARFAMACTDTSIASSWCAPADSSSTATIRATTGRSAAAVSVRLAAGKVAPTPDWHPYYQGRDVHTLQSVTKSHAKAVNGGWDYGLQWWIAGRGGADVWAGRGFGGQLLIVIPSRDIVTVVHAWNIFGDKVKNVFEPLVDALLAAR